MVYELGDEAMRKELVDNLVSTLATGKAKKTTEAQRKDETYLIILTTSLHLLLIALYNREVIPEGALGSVPKELGQSGLSTYKELCSVANELVSEDLE